VVDTKFVRLVERLYDGEVGLRGVVHVDAAQARCREQLRACGRYGEDIASFRMRRVHRVKREVLFRLGEVSKTFAGLGGGNVP
jgi:hypothetical protein